MWTSGNMIKSILAGELFHFKLWTIVAYYSVGIPWQEKTDFIVLMTLVDVVDVSLITSG